MDGSRDKADENADISFVGRGGLASPSQQIEVPSAESVSALGTARIVHTVE